MTDAPEHGARFDITRADGAYDVVVHAPGASYEARVTITSEQLDTRWTSEPPRWIVETTQGFMKTLQKNHASDESWPSKLVRWRSARE